MNTKKLLIIVVVVVVVAAVLFIACTCQVPAGYNATVTTFGKVEDLYFAPFSGFYQGFFPAF